MSVVATYVRLDEATLEALRGNSGWLDTLYGGSVPGTQVMDIDKACDGLVWLLSRVPPTSVPPVEGSGFVLRRSLAPLLSGLGGAKEPRLEAPYGPACSLTPQQVAELSEWLRAVDVGRIREQYQPKAMAKDGVYPQIWMQEKEAALEAYLLPHLARLRDFITEAAQAGQALLVFFT